MPWEAQASSAGHPPSSGGGGAQEPGRHLQADDIWFPSSEKSLGTVGFGGWFKSPPVICHYIPGAWRESSRSHLWVFSENVPFVPRKDSPSCPTRKAGPSEAGWAEWAVGPTGLPGGSRDGATRLLHATESPGRGGEGRVLGHIIQLLLSGGPRGWHGPASELQLGAEGPGPRPKKMGWGFLIPFCHHTWPLTCGFEYIYQPCWVTLSSPENRES